MTTHGTVTNNEVNMYDDGKSVVSTILFMSADFVYILFTSNSHGNKENKR